MNLKRNGEKYADKEAATEMHGDPDKKPLTLDRLPFLVFFEYEENQEEGYWAYNNMVLQFEDAVNFLKVMHPEFDFVFFQSLILSFCLITVPVMQDKDLTA